QSGQANRVLVIGSETFSKLMDWTDRSTCVLFGDGAGALVLGVSKDDRGILSTTLQSDGAYKDILFVDGGVSMQTTGHLRMQGKEVFRHAVDKLSTTALNALMDAGLATDDIDWIVPHQANKRILEGVSKKLKVPMNQIVMTVQNHGNTSAASIPLALATAQEEGKLQPGQIIVSGAIGGGLAWGTAIIRW
ncbi:MAG: 3-oxoacyl-[acyl-carrier-protein] synthase III C-terminal domain-containing protein, partial [Pseudomonadota bacterium]